MFYIQIWFIVIFIILFFISKKRSLGPAKLKNKKESKIECLYPMAEYLIKILQLEKLRNKNSNIETNIKKLNPSSKSDKVLKEYLYKKISIILIILFSVNLVSLLYQIDNRSKPLIKNSKYLERPSPGMGPSQEEFNVYLKGKEEIAIKDFIVKIHDRRYTDKEVLELFALSERYLDTQILGTNRSFNEIYYDLNFIAFIPETKIPVNWVMEEFTLLDMKGRVHNENVKEGGELVKIRAELSYDGHEFEYNRELRIMPKIFTEEEMVYRKLREDLEKNSEKTKNEDFLELPRKSGGYQVLWEPRGRISSLSFTVFACAISIIYWIKEDKQLAEDVKKRNDQMLRDYPEVVNKFTLLVNAGMTLQQAWIKIIEDYVIKKEKYNLEKRYVYEEMLITVNELRLGVSETKAYEEFGKRVGVLPYMKFSSLIAQNLKKGGQTLSKMLNYEAKEAFNLRKGIAKQQGEEASTKLLAPMIIILFIVISLVLFPAIASFKLF